MDNQNNAGMPGMPGDMTGAGTPPPPPPPPGAGLPPIPPMQGEDPHSEVMAALKRIEDKLSAIAAKLGA